jgi:hypothetical protein
MLELTFHNGPIELLLASLFFHTFFGFCRPTAAKTGGNWVKEKGKDK